MKTIKKSTVFNCINCIIFKEIIQLFYTIKERMDYRSNYNTRRYNCLRRRQLAEFIQLFSQLHEKQANNPIPQTRLSRLSLNNCQAAWQ